MHSARREVIEGVFVGGKDWNAQTVVIDMQLKAGVARSPREEDYVVDMMISHASIRNVIEKCSLMIILGRRPRDSIKASSP